MINFFLRIADSAASTIGASASTLLKGSTEFYQGYSEVRAERLNTQLALTNGDANIDEEYKELNLDENQLELSSGKFKGEISKEVKNYKLDEEEFLQNYLESSDEEEECWLDDSKKGSPFDFDFPKPSFGTKRLTLSSETDSDEESFGFKKKDVEKGPSLQQLLGTHPGILEQTNKVHNEKKRNMIPKSAAASLDETWDLFS